MKVILIILAAAVRLWPARGGAGRLERGRGHLEKASYVLYYHGGRWLELQGAD